MNIGCVFYCDSPKMDDLTEQCSTLHRKPIKQGEKK